MNKKTKWAILLLVFALTCGIVAGCGGVHEHSYTEWGHSETQHWKQCPKDGAKDDSTVANHGTPNAEGKCPDCGYQITEPHTHAYTEWGSSLTSHWKQCPDDGEIDNSTKAPHGEPDAEGKCPDCGYQILTYINQSFTLVLRKDGINTNLTSLEGVQVALSQSGNELVEDTDYQVERGEDGVLTVKRIVSGDYAVTILTADGEYRYSETIKLDGTESKEAVLQYNYAIASSQAYYVDLTHMNDEDRILAINTSSVDGFWQWNSAVAEITLNLADEIANSKNVMLEFKLKASNPNNQPNNAFGIVMTESYKGVALSIWDTANKDDGIKLHNLVGQKLGSDVYSADSSATLKWLETALYGENGLDVRVIRSNTTLKYFVKKDGKWIGLKSIACPENAKTEIKFMGAGSDYTITNITVDGAYTQTAQTYNTTLTVLDAQGNKVTLAEGTKGLLIAGETRYEVALTKNNDGTYAITGEFTPGLYSLSILGTVNNYTSASVQLGETMENVQITLGAYAAATVYDPNAAEGIQLADVVSINDGKIAVAGNKKGGFWQWGHNNTVPAATLNLSDEIKMSRNVLVDFKLKATNPNNQPNNAFGIALTQFHNGAVLSFWDTVNEANGIGLYELKGTWLGEDGWGDDKAGTFKWLETAIYGNGANFRAERNGATITLSARKDGEWVKVYEVECYEYAETMVKFLAIGSDYEISGIRVRVPKEGDLAEYDVTASFAEDANHGYVLNVEPIVEEGGEVTLTIITSDANKAWSYFPSAITVNGLPVDFSTVVRESLSANRCKYTLVISDILDNTNIVVTVAKGEKVNYAASVNDDTMGDIVCDMENDGKVYYWNDACGLTLTANAGYRLKSIVIGEGDDAQTITEGWEKNGLVYSYTFLVTGDVKVVANYEETPALDLSNTTINVVDKENTAIVLSEGGKLALSGDYEYELVLTKQEDGTYTAEGNVYEGEYIWYITGTYMGYVSENVEIMADTTAITLKFGDFASAIKYHHGDNHGMGAIDFETLISVDNNTAKINTAKANGKQVDGFWCWGSQVPEVMLNISNEVKKASNVQLEFNLKAANCNESPNNAFGVAMTEGYKGLNMSIWSKNEKLAYYALTGNVLGNQAYNASNNTHDEWLKTAIYSENGANFRVIRNGASIKFFAQNANAEWVKFFETACAENAKNDIKFLGMGSDYTVSAIRLTLPQKSDAVAVNSSVNNDEYGVVTLDKNEYYVNEECTVTVTAEAGYELESLTLGGNAVECTVNNNVYTYTFIVTGEIDVVATLKMKPLVDVTYKVSAKDTDGTTDTVLANGMVITLTNTVDETLKYTYTVGGESNPAQMAIGEYKVTCYGYADTIVTVGAEGGEIAVNLVKVIAYADSGDITIDSANGTIAIKGNGIKDRAENRKINAEYVISDEVKNATDITLTFTVKATKKDGRGGDDWAASRFGVQIGEGEIGFMVFPRNNSTGTASDVAKLIPGTNLSLNPDNDGKTEQKWHGDDSDLAWLANALYSDNGVEFKIERSGGVISVYANSGEDWVALDTMGTKGETAGKDDIGKLTIADTVKNEIKFTAGGDNWTFLSISVTVNTSNEGEQA